MARRKASKGEIQGTGIYIERPDNRTLTLADFAAELVEGNDPAKLFQAVGEHLRRILRRYTGMVPTEAGKLVPQSSGEWPHVLPADDAFPPGTPPEEIRAARDARRAAFLLRIVLDQIANGDRRHVARHAFELGRLCERMQVRFAEPHAMKGRMQGRYASAGGIKTNAPYAEKRKQYQADVEAAMAADRWVSFTEARRRVAKKHGVSFETVKKYTTKPKAKKVKR